MQLSKCPGTLLFLVAVLIVSVLVLSGCSRGSTSAAVFTPPGAPATINVSLNPSTVSPGQSATLTWSSQNATACTGSGSWSGSQPTTGSLTVTLQGTAAQTYTLNCTGAGRSAESTVTLQAEEACAASHAVGAHAGKRSSPRRKLPGAHS